jgi:hypothetical protein
MRTSLALLALVALVPSKALADEPSLHADGYVPPTIVPYEGGDIPSNARLVTQPNYYLLGTGIGLFGASYAGALIYALSTCSAQETCRGGSNYLYIPIVGPFITAAANETPTTGGRALAAFDGGVQVFSAALAVASFVWPKKLVMWQGKSAALKVTPMSGVGAPGSVIAQDVMGTDRGGVSAGVGLTLMHL